MWCFPGLNVSIICILLHSLGKQSRSVLKFMFGGDQLFDKIIPFRSSAVLFAT